MDAAEWLFSEMANLKSAYFIVTQREPACWLMGRDDVVLLCRTLRQKYGIAADPREPGGLKYEGIPVIVKATKGVEIGMDFVGANTIAMRPKPDQALMTNIWN